MKPILLAGSRSLPPSAAPLVAQVVASVLASGASVHVGCCTGADALVLSACRSSSFPRVRVFAAWSAAGVGACAVSSVAPVLAFARAGGSVSWLAGGSVSVPLPARLLRRSLAALAGCSVAVFFSPGAGSLAVAAAAVRAGVPVFAFASAAPALPRGVPGAWVASAFLSLPCWSFQAAAVQACLF